MVKHTRIAATMTLIVGLLAVGCGDSGKAKLPTLPSTSSADNATPTVKKVTKKNGKVLEGGGPIARPTLTD